MSKITASAAMLGMLSSTLALPRVHSPSASSLVIATFDGAKGTSLTWAAENDPVMGGQSVSTFKDDTAQGFGEWSGEVKVVPFLHAPGFCTIRTEHAKIPDMSSYDGMRVQLIAKAGTALSSFQMQMTSAVKTGPRKGEFQAVFNLTKSAGLQDIFVPFSAFVEDWRGEHEGGAPSKAQLAAMTQIGLGSSGIAGKFNLAIKSISVGSAQPGPAPGPAAAGVTLLDFGAKVTTWRVTNDPVMGGLSHSTFKVDKQNETGLFYGEVKIVPKLKAPGFCNAESNAGLFKKYADASGYDALEIVLKNLGELTAFKSSFGTKAEAEFGSFKAGFNVTSATSDWQTVTIPWDSYTNKWSDFTGGCTDHGAVCCDAAHREVCPTKKALADISDLGIWGEGTAGQFSLVIKSIRAVSSSADSSWMQ